MLTYFSALKGPNTFWQTITELIFGPVLHNAWQAIRISGGMLPKIKYIAAYQTQPVSAITHFAPVAHIKLYGDNGKYKLVFSEPAKEIGPIPFGKTLPVAMRGPRYTTLNKLQSAKTVGRSSG